MTPEECFDALDPLSLLEGLPGPVCELLDDNEQLAELSVPATAGASKALQLFNDLPAREIEFDAGLARFATPDSFPTAFGQPDGQLCVLYLEGFHLRALYSADRGQTFDPEVDVSGSPSTPDVRYYDAVLSSDGVLYVAMIVADPGGGLGLQFVKSADMGRSWSGPVSLVGYGDPANNLLISEDSHLGFGNIWRTLAIDASPSGVVAITFVVRDDWGVWVVASADAGENWGEPLRVDRPSPDERYATSGLDVAVQPTTGAIHVAFSQRRRSSLPTGFQIWTTRSLDFGANFGAESSLMPLVPESDDSLNPDVAIGSDGAILITFAGRVHSHQPNRIFSVRSSDGGLSYSKVVDTHVQPRFFGSPLPRLTPANSSSTVLLAYNTGNDDLIVHRSPDNGSSFEPAQTIAQGTAAGTGREDINVVQTAAGTWAIAWNDLSRLFGGGNLFYRTSADDGATWDPEYQVPWAITFLDRWFPPGMDFAAVGDDGLVLTFLQDGNETGFFRVYSSNTSDPAVPASAPLRIDADSSEVELLEEAIAVATDGGEQLYAAWVVRDERELENVYLARSGDRGLTFSDPVRIGPQNTVAGYIIDLRVSATADGYVYLAYTFRARSGTIRSKVLYNVSHDFGATWQEENTVVGVSGSTIRSVDLVSTPGGRVYVGWTLFREVNLARSTDAGSTFQVDRIDQGQASGGPVNLCARGNHVVASWLATDVFFPDDGVVATTSNDEGVTWTPTRLWYAIASQTLFPPGLTCTDSGEAVVGWTSYGAGTMVVRASRFDGTSWGVTITADLPEAVSVLIFPSLAYSTDDGSTIAMVSHSSTSSGTPGVYANVSIDGGATFLPGQRLDQAEPGPYGGTGATNIAADGLGNVWISWVDRNSGSMPSLLVRRSTDGGMTFGPARRVNRESPQSAFFNLLSVNTETTSLPGVAFFPWIAERRSFFHWEVLMNTDDLRDADRDGFGPDADCDDNDPNTYPGAPQICDGVNNDCDDPGWPTPPLDETPVDGVLPCAADCGIVVTLDPAEIWPPDHRMVDVHAVVSTSDSCDVSTLVLESITSNEPDDSVGGGDGRTVDDIQNAAFDTTDVDFRLRAERAGSGDGRLYTVVYSVIDATGSRITATGFVTVPHDRGGVTEPMVLRLTENGFGTMVSWEPVQAAPFYDVIRGTLTDVREQTSVVNLGAVTCIEAGSFDEDIAGSEDAVVPAAGEVFFYLVKYGDVQASSYGTEGAIKPRMTASGDCR